MISEVVSVLNTWSGYKETASFHLILSIEWLQGMVEGPSKLCKLFYEKRSSYL